MFACFFAIVRMGLSVVFVCDLDRLVTKIKRNQFIMRLFNTTLLISEIKLMKYGQFSDKLD